MKRVFAGLMGGLLVVLGGCGQAKSAEESSTAAFIEPEQWTEKPTPIMDYPESYRDAPQEYKPILGRYYAYAQALGREQFTVCVQTVGPTIPLRRMY